MDRWTALVSPRTAAVHSSVVQILSRKQSVPSGDCRGHSGAYVFRVVPTLGGRRTTDTGLPTFDSKSSTPALLEPVDLITDCSLQHLHFDPRPSAQST